MDKYVEEKMRQAFESLESMHAYFDRRPARASADPSTPMRPMDRMKHHLRLIQGGKTDD